jgi:hypothetical protein
MEYTCKHCNKGYASYQSRCNHIRRYHKSKLSIDKSDSKKDDKSTNKPNISMKNEENLDEYKCKNCSKTYRHFQSRWKHEKTCKNININPSENKIDEMKKKMDKEIAEIKKEMEIKMNKEIEKMKDILQKSLKIHPKTLNKINNQLNNSGTINNITIIQLGHENLSEILNTKQKKNILNRQAMSLNDLVDLVHVSGKYKNFQNVYITNLQSTFAYKFDEKANKFIAVNKNELLNDLVDSRMYDIEKFYEEVSPELEPRKAEQIKKFIDRMGNEEDGLKGIKKEEIKLILYNNKDKIIKNSDSIELDKAIII